MSACKAVLNFTRQFSNTSVKSAAMIKPPVPVFGVEGRYATALYSAAMKEKKIDAVEKDIKDLKDLLAKDVKLSEFILNPLLKVNVKVDALKKVFAKKNYSPLTLNLIISLAENGRLKSLSSVLSCFNGVMSSIRGEVICQVVTAKPLDAPTLAEFEKTLKSFVKKNEKIFIETKVDPSIIGGAIVTIGDKYVDMSIASKIKAYNSVLREIV
ncbi:ATP synthase subunit O, mitochondrial [Trichonephila clavata]|uniref:Oligomycin sensitivity conferral protein n=1 Tax=Trichonephila clavata TaxID=2740835 RepID=A0A8X6GUE8_TRICU|nr:ATP synthase subunit O, mitochondrial [Trichonephila clavata]